MSTEDNKPIKRFKSGVLTLAVWENQYDNTFTITRNFKRRDSEAWEFTNTLRRVDLLPAMSLLLQASLSGITEIEAPAAANDSDPFADRETIGEETYVSTAN